MLVSHDVSAHTSPKQILLEIRNNLLEIRNMFTSAQTTIERTTGEIENTNLGYYLLMGMFSLPKNESIPPDIERALIFKSEHVFLSDQ